MITDEVSFYYLLLFTLFFSTNFLFFVSFVRNKTFKLMMTLSVTGLISVVYGVRGSGIGLDTSVYLDIYHNLDARPLEPIFSVLFELGRILSLNDTILLLLISSLINFILLLAFYMVSDDYPILLALCNVSHFYVNMNISIIRQGLALSLFVLAIALFVKNKYWKTFFVGVFAVLSHMSAVIIFPIMVFGRLKFNNYLLMIYVIGVLFLSTFKLSTVLAPFIGYHSIIAKAYWYFTWGIAKAWHVKHVYYLVFLLFGFCLMWLRNSPYEKIRKYNLIFAIGIFTIFLFKEEEMVVDRFFYFFFPIVVIMIYLMNSKFKNTKLYFGIVFLGMNGWLYKTMFMQYPKWFIFPYEAIR